MSRNRISKNELNEDLKNDIYAIASTEKLGNIKVDGNTIKVDENTGIASVQIGEWIPLTLNAEWTLREGGLFIRKEYDFARIYDSIQNSGNSNNTPFTLPEEFKPLYNTYQLCNGTSLVYASTLLTSGNVFIPDTNNGLIFLNITYRIQ